MRRKIKIRTFFFELKVKDRDNDESFKKFMTLIDKQLNSTNSLKTEPFEEAIKQFVEKTVSEHESTEIQEQIKVITKFRFIQNHQSLYHFVQSRSTNSGIKCVRHD